MAEKRRILIVDDDREIVRGLAIRLRAAGYETLSAHDGEEGLAAAIAEHPDAIVLDIRMPRTDGLAVLAKLREREDTKAIPVVVISANVVENTRAKALELGARYFVVKPFQATTLISTIESVVAEPSAISNEQP